jgi:8-amino-7-oxononanoate synthase
MENLPSTATLRKGLNGGSLRDIFDKCARALIDTGEYFEPDRPVIDRVLFRAAPVDNAGPWIEVEGRRVLQLSTNDYLGLCNHPKVREASRATVAAYGVGLPMGARALSGNTDLHLALERAVAELKGTETAIVFSSGVDAMMGAIAALGDSRDWVILDSHVHASLVCGARIAMARIRLFRHNDLEDLESILRDVPPARGAIVVVNGVYSMRGDLAPLPGLCELCRRYGARIVLDDAHGTGVMGGTGRGTAEHFGVEPQIDLHLGTFSKAAGTSGGFVAGPQAVIDYVAHHAPTMLFTKAMSAGVAAATRQSLRLMAASGDLRARLWHNARLIQTRLRELEYDLGDTASPITPIHCKGNDAMYLADTLFREFGIWCGVAIYPAVPLGVSVLRITPTALHTPEAIDRFLSAMTTLREWAPRCAFGRGLALDA